MATQSWLQRELLLIHSHVKMPNFVAERIMCIKWYKRGPFLLNATTGDDLVFFVFLYKSVKLENY